MNLMDNMQIANAHHKVMNDRQTKAVIDEICQFIEFAGRGTEARIGSLRGPSRVGKTTIVRKIRSLFPSIVEGGVRRQPIISVKIPGVPTIKSVLTGCLESLGAKSLHRDTTPQLIQRLKHYISECGVRLIVLDEFQHLHDVRGASRSGVHDTIKSILNDCRCPILAVGIENSLDVILADPQLDGRCIYRRELRPFQSPSKSNDTEQIPREVPERTFKEFQNVVHQFFAAYDLQVADDLLQGESAMLLHDATKGLYGRLIDVVDQAATVSKSRKLRTVTSEVVREVIERMIGDQPLDEMTPIEIAVAAAQSPRKRPYRRKDSHIISRIEEGSRKR